MRIVLLGLFCICTAASAHLSGRVSSAEEGAMEGVLVSAKKQGSTITTTVVSDQDGRYRFPAKKLSPGRYTLTVRVVGYELEHLVPWSFRQVDTRPLLTGSERPPQSEPIDFHRDTSTPILDQIVYTPTTFCGIAI